MDVLVRVLLAAVLCWMTLRVKGLTITVNNGQNSISVSNDNMTRISVYDFEFVSSPSSSSSDFNRALRCQSELSASDVTESTHVCRVGGGGSPVTCNAGSNNTHTIEWRNDRGITRGWSGRRVANEGSRRVHYIWRRSQTPEEGYINCYFRLDTNEVVGLYILYPITEVTAAIEVEAGTLTFSVRCTSTGGRALNMAVSGPNGYNSDISTNIQAVDTPQFLSNDKYTARTDVISSGMVGDEFQCNVTSFASNFSSVTLKAAVSTITELMQTALTTVMVTWTPPSGATVTGYTVRYRLASGNGDDGTKTVSQGSTSTPINDLTNGETYTFSIEAIASNMLPGVSEEMTITLAPDTPEDVVTAAESSSVTVSWGAVDDANRYTVTFSMAQETNQEGLCPTDSHTATLTVDAPSTTVSIAVGGDVGSTMTDELRAYTTYEVTVEAVSDVRGTSRPSGTRRVLTPQTSAREAPGDVRAETESSTEISVLWSGLSNCRLVNGRITQYRVRYTANMTEDYTLRDGEDWRSGGRVTLTGLTPSTNYSISVAAVNEDGDVGLYSDPVTATDRPREQTSDNSGAVAAAVVIPLLVIIVAVVAGVILFVWWRRRGSSEKSYLPPPQQLSDINPAPVRYSKTSENSRNEEKFSEPVISRFPEDKHTMEGERVVFRVKVSGVPHPKLTWYHNGVEVAADYSRELGEDGTLSMPSSESKHSGVYKLLAVNRAGSMEKEVKLFVKREGEPSPFVARKQISFSPIPLDNFGQYVASGHANDNRVFRDQYTELDRDADHPKTIGTSQELKLLNRFGNITVYDNNRIALRPIEGHADCQRDFINACYVDGYKFRNKFIATQGPLPKTVVDFWRLVWQEKPPTIVMVTNLKEGTKIKCQQYWPESGTRNFGPFQVTISEEQTLADYTTRTLLVQLKGSSERALKVTQFHFTAWPDHGVPDYATPILAFHKKIRKQHRPSKGPLLVHCSAGVGRTGTLITIDRVLDQISKEKMVDVAGVVQHLRGQRMKMVQNPEQYIFIHDAILEAVTCGDTQIGASDLRRSIQILSRRDPKTSMTGFESQFKVLEQVSPRPDQVPREKALDNPTKNRSEDFLPGDRWRVVLKGETEDYIHAVAVNGYKQQRAFIIAQSPMQSTARDFWKTVYDRKCGVVVMLCDLVESGKDVCYKYWPSSGVQQVGEYTIDMLGEEKLEGFTIRTFGVLHKKTNKSHQVQQIHIQGWRPDGQCSNLGTITAVIGEVTKIQQRTGNNPILVHCSDTVSRSGMFCAIATTIERCKTEGVVDVFQVVKALRVQKPGAVRTVAQYHTLFETVLVYLDSFDTYGNFQDI